MFANECSVGYGGSTQSAPATGQRPGAWPHRGKRCDMANDTCSVDGCAKPSRNRGWCSAHYERWRRNGDPGEAGDARRTEPRPCAIDGCDKRAVGRGWCGMHWARWKRNGDPERVVRAYGEYRSTMSSGYARVWCPGHPAASADGYALEHRKVVIDAGIDIPVGHHVHHINHNKSDNRLENLQVMSASEHGASHYTGCNQYGHLCDEGLTPWNASRACWGGTA